VEPTAAPFQWGLLAWAALVGLLTGVAIVGFHYLLGFINNLIYGPFVEFVMGIAGPQPTLPEPLPLPPPPASTPLRSLLQLGLGGVGLFAPVPLPQPEPVLPPVPLAPPWLSTWPVVLGPVLGGLLVGLLRLVAKDLGPSLPSLMAMADGRMQAAAKLPFARLLGASISLGSGASLGPEGPSVESGGNIGLWLGRRAGLTPEALRALVGAGVAAGLAAGFRAPIAGVFFAFEGAYSTIPGRPSLRAVLVAAVSSTLVIQLGLGDQPIFRLPSYEVRSPLELPLYLGLGLLASGVSLALVRLLALGKAAEVLTLSDDGQELTVRCGVLRSTVPLEAIEGLNGEKPASPEPPRVRVRGGMALAGQGAQVRTARNTVDVRGLRVHEAEAAVEESLRAASGPVWVIHGHGTGKLKRGLREWLEGVPYVERVVDAEPGDGGGGCSVVWLK